MARRMSYGGGGSSSTSLSGSHLKDGAIDLIAGTLGGMANVYAGQPLDTVKVREFCERKSREECIAGESANVP